MFFYESQCKLIYTHPSTKKDIATERLHAQYRSVTDGISQRVTSGWHYTTLTLVDHGVKVNKEY